MIFNYLKQSKVTNSLRAVYLVDSFINVRHTTTA